MNRSVPRWMSGRPRNPSLSWFYSCDHLQLEPQSEPHPLLGVVSQTIPSSPR